MTITNNKAKNGFLELCAQLNEKRDLEVWFDTFFTHEEKKALENRYLIIKELLKNKPQRQIANELKVSISKITRGSHSLKNIDHEFKQKLLGIYDEK